MFAGRSTPRLGLLRFLLFYTSTLICSTASPEYCFLKEYISHCVSLILKIKRHLNVDLNVHIEYMKLEPRALHIDLLE